METNENHWVQLNPSTPVYLEPIQSIDLHLTYPVTLTTYQYNQILLLIHSSRVILSKDLITQEIDEPISANLPLFFKDLNLIKVPKKVERIIKRYIPRALLRDIHDDKITAVDLCLMFLSRLSSTYFTMKDNPYDPVRGAGWKALHTDILIREFNLEINTYKKIVTALSFKTSMGAILECDKKKIIGEKCFFYRLGEHYRCKGVVGYHVTSPIAKKLLNKTYFNRLSETSDNVITRNLLKLYGRIELPTKEEIIIEAKRLINLGYKTKKGKKLTFLNKHSREYFVDHKNRSFVEDALEIYEYLTDNGLMIPQVGDERSGGRIVDSFTLMPSWIRNLCKIDGKRIVEVDYSCLHPNICSTIYNGNKKYITHKQIASETGIEESIVKTEHLSFFNKQWEDMLYSPLFPYYTQSEPTMMSNIYFDKKESIYGHKIASRRLLKKEVVILTDVIEKLNRRKIFVGYVYDALFCTEEEKEIIMMVMNEVVTLHGVYTTAK